MQHSTGQSKFICLQVCGSFHLQVAFRCDRINIISYCLSQGLHCVFYHEYVCREDSDSNTRCVDRLRPSTLRYIVVCILYHMDIHSICITEHSIGLLLKTSVSCLQDVCHAPLPVQDALSSFALRMVICNWMAPINACTF